MSVSVSEFALQFMSTVSVSVSKSDQLFVSIFAMSLLMPKLAAFLSTSNLFVLVPRPLFFLSILSLFGISVLMSRLSAFLSMSSMSGISVPVPRLSAFLFTSSMSIPVSRLSALPLMLFVFGIFILVSRLSALSSLSVVLMPELRVSPPLFPIWSFLHILIPVSKKQKLG